PNRSRYLAVMPSSPVPEGADREQHAERDQEEQNGDRRGADRVARLDLARDVDRGNLGLERDVSRDQHDGSELADGAGKCKRDAGENRGEQVREDDAAEDRESPGAERLRRL